MTQTPRKSHAVGNIDATSPGVRRMPAPIVFPIPTARPKLTPRMERSLRGIADSSPPSTRAQRQLRPRFFFLLLHRFNHEPPDDRDDTGQEQRPEYDDQATRRQSTHGHGGPVAPFGAHGAVRLAANPDEEKARRHLPSALEQRERRCAPRPALNREVREVRAGHEEQEEQTEGERPAEKEPPIRPVRQRVGAIDAEQDSCHQRHLDERQREPAEGARLLDMPLDSVTREEGHGGGGWERAGVRCQVLVQTSSRHRLPSSRLLDKRLGKTVATCPGHVRNSWRSEWKWCTPFSRAAEYRPRSYTRERRLRWTTSQISMSSAWISSENSRRRDHLASAAGFSGTSFANHSKITFVRSRARGKTTF